MMGPNARTRIKICGLRRTEDVRAVNEAKPDMAGFILSPGFRRSVRLEDAFKLADLLDPCVTVVGVFVDEPIEHVARFTHHFDFDGFEPARGIAVQLHGDESDDYIDQLRHAMAYPGWYGIPIIKACTVRTREDVERACRSKADLVLLDNGQGSGKTFDWSLLDEVDRSYVLAGGLGPENVADAVRRMHPFAVDMSSGVETNGWKDPSKIREAVGAVRGES